MSFVTFSEKTTNPDAKSVIDVTAKEVYELRTNIALIDVRKPEEFTGELGHIPNAKLIVLDTLKDNIDQLPKDKSIVFICRSGRRSIDASLIAQENGFEQTYNMVGGMIEWNKLGFATEK